MSQFEPTYQIKVSLEEWQMWQRFKQVVKAYDSGKLLIEWVREHEPRLTWYLVGKAEPNRDDM